MLFIGNSHTYFHGMPYQCREMLKHIGIDSRVSLVTQPGESLLWHTKNPATKLALSFGDWDHIIVQQVTYPFGGGPEFTDEIKGLLELVPEGPQVWFYKT